MNESMQRFEKQLIEWGYRPCTDPQYKDILKTVADRPGQKVFEQLYDAGTSEEIHRLVLLLPWEEPEVRRFGSDKGVTVAQINLSPSAQCSAPYLQFGNFDGSGKPLDRSAQELTERLFD